MRRRALTAGLASATVALGGAITATSVPAQAADSDSPLVLSAPREVTVKSYRGWVYSNLGVKMTAQNSDFEIQATREPSGEQSWWDRSYNSPITATWKRWDADGNALPDVALPEGSMSTWQGLDDFASISITPTGEGKVKTVEAKGCFNGEARRIGPAGPQTNPYPWGCPYNAYTLGSVMGVAQDYRSSLLPEWGTNLRLKPGTYDMSASIAGPWRDFFGIDDADGVVDTTLIVKKANIRGGGVEFRGRGTDDLEPAGAEPARSSAGAMPHDYAPDLRALPAFGIGLNNKGTAMRFGATVWNGGAGPMVIEGFRDSRQDEAMTAYQYYFDEHGEQVGYDQVGQLHFHEGNHHHWHFEDFARYRLYGADENGDRTKAVVKSTKQSFCLVATDAVDLTVPNADMRPEYTDLGSQCGGPGALHLREVLANGHGDTYYQYRTGQAFRLGDLPDGIYYIGVNANPDDKDGRNLNELDTTNNNSFRKVELFTNANGVRKVRSFQVGIIDENSEFGGFRQPMR